jgi:hypothetical protein
VMGLGLGFFFSSDSDILGLALGVELGFRGQD